MLALPVEQFAVIAGICSEAINHQMEVATVKRNLAIWLCAETVVAIGKFEAGFADQDLARPAQGAKFHDHLHGLADDGLLSLLLLVAARFFPYRREVRFAAVNSEAEFQCLRL